VSAQAFDNLNLLLQLLQATRNLARDMVQNANTHKAMANAQNPDVVTLGRFVTDSATSYNRILSTAKTWVQNNNAQATAAVGLIGATIADLNAYTAPIQTAITNLSSADVSTYAAIISACNSVLATVPSPNSVFAGLQSF
jgi:hypothetical protein